MAQLFYLHQNYSRFGGELFSISFSTSSSFLFSSAIQMNSLLPLPTDILLTIFENNKISFHVTNSYAIFHDFNLNNWKNQNYFIQKPPKKRFLIELDKKDITEEFLSKNKEVQFWLNEALYLVVKEKENAIAEILIDYGADPGFFLL